MNKLVIVVVVLFFFFTQVSFAQRLEVFGGWNKNNFINNDGVVERKVEKPGFGYGGGIGLDVKVVKKATFGLVLKMDHYEGSFFARSGGLGAYRNVTASITKSVVALDAYPLNLLLLKERLRFGLGLEYNRRVSQKIEGEVYTYWKSSGDQTFAIDKAYTKKIEENNNIGFIARMSYDIKIADKWFIVPQYQFYLGLTTEYNNLPARKIHSRRHNLYLGIAKRI
jgi:hypothetical protein